MKGVLCPSCERNKMTFYYGKWYCSNCHSQSNEAHKQAFADYALLLIHILTIDKRENFSNYRLPMLQNEYYKKQILTQLEQQVEGGID